ncbi:MAG: hypothetical protein V1753_09770 [Pseudomonadota bacterium]
MQDDFIKALNYAVQEEVLGRYFHARRVVELQLEHINELRHHAKKSEEELSQCLAGFYDLLIDRSFINHFLSIASQTSYEFLYKSCLILNPRMLSERRKYKRLLFRKYEQISKHSEKYRLAYLSLEEECGAVNHNIEKFSISHDVLLILQFLRSMDSELVAKKYFLGGNFNAKEISALAETLAFPKICFQRFLLPEPYILPEISEIKKKLTSLAEAVFSFDPQQVCAMLRY